MVAALTSRQSIEGSRFPTTQMGALKPAAARPSYLRPVQTSPEIDMAAELDRIGTNASYAGGRAVVEDGQPALNVFKVVGGTLRAVRLLPDGRRHIVQFLSAGDFFGLTEGEEYALSVEALSDVTVMRYPRRGFEALLDRNPRAGHWLFNIMCRELAAAHDQSLLLGRKNALERMASFLIAIADRQPRRRASEGREIDLSMSRTDIADYLGLTIETVSRLLRELRSRHIIEMPSTNHIVFRNLAALDEIASGEGTTEAF